MKNLTLISYIVLFLLSLSSHCLADEQSFKYPTAADYPAIPKVAKSAADFVPKGWSILGKASGDLNGDKVIDEAQLRRLTMKVYSLAEKPKVI